MTEKSRRSIMRALKSHCIKSGLTQQELARRIGTTQSAISDLFGPGGNPRLSTLTRLCEALGVALVIVSSDDKPEPEIIEHVKHVIPNDFTVRVTYGPHDTRTVSTEEDHT